MNQETQNVKAGGEFAAAHGLGITFASMLTNWRQDNEHRAETWAALAINGEDESMLCRVDVRVTMPDSARKQMLGDLSFGKRFKITIEPMMPNTKSSEPAQ